MRTLFIVVAAMVSVTPVPAQNQDVSIKSSDGFQLQGRYADAGRIGPAFLLLPACDGDRKMFENLVDLLSNAGYNVLSLDYRGMGGSKAGTFTDFAPQRDDIMKLMPGDIDAALAFLAMQKNVNASRVGIVGVGCGVAHATAAARRDARVKAAVLLSGTPNAVDVEHIKATKMPVFAAADIKDAAGTTALKEAVEASSNVDSQFVSLNSGAQGAALFTKEPDLEVDIVIWSRKGFPIASYAPLR